MLLDEPLKVLAKPLEPVQEPTRNILPKRLGEPQEVVPGLVLQEFADPGAVAKHPGFSRWVIELPNAVGQLFSANRQGERRGRLAFKVVRLVHDQLTANLRIVINLLRVALALALPEMGQQPRLIRHPNPRAPFSFLDKGMSAIPVLRPLSASPRIGLDPVTHFAKTGSPPPVGGKRLQVVTAPVGEVQQYRDHRPGVVAQVRAFLEGFSKRVKAKVIPGRFQVDRTDLVTHLRDSLELAQGLLLEQLGMGRNDIRSVRLNPARGRPENWKEVAPRLPRARRSLDQRGLTRPSQRRGDLFHHLQLGPADLTEESGMRLGVLPDLWKSLTLLENPRHPRFVAQNGPKLFGDLFLGRRLET